MALYALDTSAVLAYVRGEPGQDEVEATLLDAKSQDELLLVPFIAMMEVEYILLREMEPEDVDRNLARIEALPIDIVESSPAWRKLAAYVKARGKVSFADAWVAALALLRDVTLIHKDPEFDAVPGLKALRLPYDRDLAGSGA
jgi:predicted nucleic acid-binding protein